MTTERSSLVVSNSCFTLLPAKQIPEHSEMIVNTDCLTKLISCDLAELVVSPYKIPAHLELTNHGDYQGGIQETTFTTGEMVVGSSLSLHMN